VFQKLHNHPLGQGPVKYLWTATDIVLVTVCLILVNGPISILPVTYTLPIAISGMFFRVRLVVFTTIVCLLGFGTLMIMRPPTAHREPVL